MAETPLNRQTSQAGLQGYSKRFERRPEFSLWGEVIPGVIDATHIRQRAVDDLVIVRIADIFSGGDEVFLVFGKPNVSHVIPDGKGGYQKFDVKSLKRAPSKVADTRGFIQSGILVRVIGLPADAAEKLREAQQFYVGQKFETCANGNMHAWQRAGFASGSKPLTDIFWPHTLLRRIRTDGLTFDGQPVSIEIIHTSRDPVQRFAASIWVAEMTTMCRHLNRDLEAKAKTNGLAKFAYSAIHLPSTVFKKKVNNAAIAKTLAPALPEGTYLEDLRLSISRPSFFGTILRQFWGAHVIFEVSQDRVKASDYFTRKLPPFPQPKPGLVTLLKKHVLFAAVQIWLISKVMAKGFVEVGQVSEVDIYDMLRTDSETDPQKYNLVITDTHIRLARIKVGLKAADWVLSKHRILAGQDVPWYASEAWKDTDGTLVINRNSGTYQPEPEELDNAIAFIHAVVPNLKVRKDSTKPA